MPQSNTTQTRLSRISLTVSSIENDTHERRKKKEKRRDEVLTRFRRIPARSSLSGVESLELLSSWWEELLALLMSILGVLGVLSELPGVAGVVTSTMPGIRAAGSPCIQIRKAGFVVSSHSHWGVMVDWLVGWLVGWLIGWFVTDNAHTGVAPSRGHAEFFDFWKGERAWSWTILRAHFRPARTQPT